MNNFSNFKIELDPREDRYKEILYMGRNQSPVSLKFNRGVTFFIFVSHDGEEEMHIGCMKTGSDCEPIKKRMNPDGTIDRYVIRLHKKEDSNKETYYMAIVQDDSLELDFQEGYLFFVFTSVEGKEELHISKNREQQVEKKPEIYLKKRNQKKIEEEHSYQ